MKAFLSKKKGKVSASTDDGSANANQRNGDSTRFVNLEAAAERKDCTNTVKVSCETERNTQTSLGHEYLLTLCRQRKHWQISEIEIAQRVYT